MEHIRQFLGFKVKFDGFLGLPTAAAAVAVLKSGGFDARVESEISGYFVSVIFGPMRLADAANFSVTDGNQVRERAIAFIYFHNLHSQCGATIYGYGCIGGDIGLWPIGTIKDNKVTWNVELDDKTKAHIAISAGETTQSLQKRGILAKTRCALYPIEEKPMHISEFRGFRIEFDKGGTEAKNFASFVQRQQGIYAQTFDSCVRVTFGPLPLGGELADLRRQAIAFILNNRTHNMEIYGYRGSKILSIGHTKNSEVKWGVEMGDIVQTVIGVASPTNAVPSQSGGPPILVFERCEEEENEAAIFLSPVASCVYQKGCKTKDSIDGYKLVDSCIVFKECDLEHATHGVDDDNGGIVPTHMWPELPTPPKTHLQMVRVLTPKKQTDHELAIAEAAQAISDWTVHPLDNVNDIAKIAINQYLASMKGKDVSQNNG